MEITTGALTKVIGTRQPVSVQKQSSSIGPDAAYFSAAAFQQGIVAPMTAKQLRSWYETNPWIFAAVDQRCTDIANADWVVGPIDPTLPWNQDTAQRITDLMTAPNPTGKNDSYAGLWHPATIDTLCLDKGAIQPLKDKGGEPYALKALDGARVFVKPRWQTDKDGARYLYMNEDGTDGAPLMNDELIVISAHPSTYSADGLAPLKVLNRILIAEYDTFKSIHILQKNRAPSAILKMPNSSKQAVDAAKGLWLDELAGRSGLGFMNIPAESDLLVLGSTNLEEQGAFAFYDMLIRAIAACFRITTLNLNWLQDVNRACHSEDTQTLTRSGWKYYWEIKEGEQIATLNPETGQMEWNAPNSLHVYPYEGEMVQFKSSGVDVLVTPEHKMWARAQQRSRSSRPWEKIEAQNLEGTSKFSFLATAPVEGRRIDTFTLPASDRLGGRYYDFRTFAMDDWLEFLGYVVSEGCIFEPSAESSSFQRYKVSLSQKKPTNVLRIQSCLERLPFAFRSYLDSDGTTRWQVSDKGLWVWLRKHIGAKSFTKRVPSFVRELCTEQATIFFEALMLGDGTTDSRPGRTNRSYATNSEGLADDVQELALRLGYSAKIVDGTRCYRVLLVKRAQHDMAAHNVSRMTYNGMVYCFNVPNHLFFTRRNGCIGIHGNTAQEQSHIRDDGTVALLKLYQGYINREIVSCFRESENIGFFYTQLMTRDEALSITAVRDMMGKNVNPWSINQALQASGYDPVKVNDPKEQEFYDKPLVSVANGQMAPPQVAMSLPQYQEAPPAGTIPAPRPETGRPNNANKPHVVDQVVGAAPVKASYTRKGTPDRDERDAMDDLFDSINGVFVEAQEAARRVLSE